MRREYPESPIVGVAAIVSRNDSVLLIHRGNEPGRGALGLPGGAVELGETAEQAIVREVKEECGIEIKPLCVIAVRDSITYDGAERIRFHYVLVEFLCSVVQGNLAASSDVLDAKWVKVFDLEKEGATPNLASFIRNALAKRVSIY